MGLDGLGSSAYGPEAALAVLRPVGALGVAWIGWIMAPIVLLLLILFASYWQTIRAYPNNGGAYIVARENLGTGFSLLAAASLMVDYMLNVAVGISAGVGALVSAAPSLHPYILPLCLAILAVITVVNLRGTPDAGRLFALPTYVFVGSFAVVIATGVVAALGSGGHPHPVMAPPRPPASSAGVDAWMLVRAFAAGCTAMTGVEAVSNGMTAFREPRVRHGRRTLSAIVAILGLLLVGIAYLSRCYGIAAMDQSQDGYRSVLSQLASAVAGNGVLYYVAIGSLLCVLSLSANTSFVDFPRLCRTVAADGFLPASFAVAGRRLVYSAGILYLAATTGLLLIVFGGITDALIPLFAVGAFLTFTLSQAGMVVHWYRGREKARRTHLLINALGTLTTGIALAVIVAAKFTEGAWITVVVIPVVVVSLRGIRHYYARLERAMHAVGPLRVSERHPPIVLLVVESWSKLVRKALEMALTLSPDVIAVHLTHLTGPEQEEHRDSLQSRWREYVEMPLRAGGSRPPPLTVLPARYRTIDEPVMKLARELERNHPQRRIAVLIPRRVNMHWYQYLLHPGRGRKLRSRLLLCGDPRLMVIEVPWVR
jgi:amino acid transporter